MYWFEFHLVMSLVASLVNCKCLLKSWIMYEYWTWTGIMTIDIGLIGWIHIWNISCCSSFSLLLVSDRFYLLDMFIGVVHCCNCRITCMWMVPDMSGACNLEHILKVWFMVCWWHIEQSLWALVRFGDGILWYPFQQQISSSLEWSMVISRCRTWTRKVVDVYQLYQHNHGNTPASLAVFLHKLVSNIHIIGYQAFHYR